ncbi:Ger(x)C family spore germination protein [Oceanobacillus salinisoli]|uniref:Ger(x)C family spore germination protein n=1 Tax=Oceanobacillus salinisoli TaxID=2678611 RepID=UPI0012E27D28|nr:Ger(x)C family spore germination protein [Oceanobacillus salinisoli]
MKILPSIGKILCLIMLIIILSGCWDKTEVEQLAYVVAIGLDKPEDEENLVEVSYIIANPEAGNQAGGASSDEPPQETISFTATDFVSSKSLANTVISKQITYDLLRFIIVSEDFAKDDDFIRWIYDATKAMEIRRDIRLMVTEEAPSTFIANNNPKLDTRPHKYFELIFRRGNDTGNIPPSRLDSFFRITEGDANVFLAIYGTTKKRQNNNNQEDPDDLLAGELEYTGVTNTTQFAGSAVFKEGKMIDKLTIEETRIAFLLSNELEQPTEILTALPDPFKDDHQLTTRISKEGNIDIRMKLNDQKPTINVTVPINMEILTNHGMTEFTEDNKKRETLEKSFEKTLNQKFEEFIKKTQEEYAAEPFGWSLEARKKFRTIPEYIEFDWMNTYPEMEINVNTKIELENFGRQSDLPDLNEMRD